MICPAKLLFFSTKIDCIMQLKQMQDTKDTKTLFVYRSLGHDLEPGLRVRGDGTGRATDGDRGGAGQDHEESGASSDGVGTVPRQKGARDQEHRASDTRGPPEGNSR